MTAQLEQVTREAAYNALNQFDPLIINVLRELIQHGETPEAIERRFAKRYGNGHLISNTVVLAAYYIKDQLTVTA